MITSTRPVLRLVSTLLFATALCATAKSQMLLVSDNFNLNGADRTTGADLDGTSPQVGTDTWSAVGAVFTSGGMITSSAANQTITGVINLPVPLTTNTLEQADVVLGGSNYFGLGFNSIKNTGTFFGTTDQVYALYQSGDVLLVDSSDGGVHVLTVVNETNDTTIANTFGLSFDPTTNTASVFVNGTAYISNYPVTPNATATTSQFYDDGVPSPGNSTIDNFQVTAVPEPATYAFFLAGGIALLVWSRRKTEGNRVA